MASKQKQTEAANGNTEGGNGGVPTTTALAILDKHGFALSRYQADELREVVFSNFDDGELSPNDLTRIRVPTGAGKAFAIPSAEAEEETVKTIQGVILHARTQRAYWEKSLDETGGGSPPDCASHDGKVGVGTPGGFCKDCPLNVFGTGKRERGKACKEMKMVFILRKDLLLPDVLVLPPTSLVSYRKYTALLTGRAIMLTSIISEVGLVEKQNKDGIKYSQLTFKGVEKLDPPSAQHVKAFAESMKSALEAIRLDVDERDVAGADAGEEV